MVEVEDMKKHVRSVDCLIVRKHLEKQDLELH